jgi:hypothetical protein
MIYSFDDNGMSLITRMWNLIAILTNYKLDPPPLENNGTLGDWPWPILKKRNRRK